MKTDPATAAVIKSLAQEDRRYREEGYWFITRTITFINRRNQGSAAPGHIDASLFLDGFRRLALREYGPLALEVLKHWGFESTDDVGGAVFAMVKKGVLQARTEDSPAEFKAVFDFRQVFIAPFFEPATEPPEGFETKPDFIV